MLNGALIGCGFFAQNQLRAWAEAGDAGIVALCDRDAARLAATAARFGIARTYDDAAEMLARERPDFVDIATTVASHVPLVTLAARAGVPVICQKPFTETLAEAAGLVETCRRAGVPLMVHENFRWQAPIRAVRRVLDEGEIGQPFWARIAFRSAYDVYAGQPYLAEGSRFIIQDLGIHLLDVARFLFGEVTTLAARTQRVNPRIAGEDVATMMLGHAAGVTTVVDCSYASAQERELFPQSLIEIDGARGTLRLGADYELVVHADGATRRETVAPDEARWGPAPWHGIQHSVFDIQEHFIACLRGGREPETSGADNLRTLALVEAAYLSAQRGGAPVDPAALVAAARDEAGG
ncbi:Gfo/Idh/MocA family protein [Acidiphilium sp.]|uniref:Gfo/Idh/MocA family protein n=1 Tax=Acidiphilium sp. TaxID=527 RepID=UPI002587AEED|nr:Gfo/Idh/MocA family oxidoreductase [Acidiphilium sp.]